MTRIFAICALAFAAVLSGFGQDVKLIILEQQDTAQLKEAYSAFQAAKEKWEQAKLEIASRYTLDESGKSHRCKVALGEDEQGRKLYRIVRTKYNLTSNMRSVWAEDAKLPDCKVMDGWNDVEFSVDFRAVVPRQRYSGSGSVLSWSSPSWSSIVPTGSTSTVLNTTSTTGSIDLSTSLKSDAPEKQQQ